MNFIKVEGRWGKGGAWSGSFGVFFKYDIYLKTETWHISTPHTFVHRCI